MTEPGQEPYYGDLQHRAEEAAKKAAEDNPYDAMAAIKSAYLRGWYARQRWENEK